MDKQIRQGETLIRVVVPPSAINLTWAWHSWAASFVLSSIPWFTNRSEPSSSSPSISPPSSICPHCFVNDAHYTNVAHTLSGTVSFKRYGREFLLLLQVYVILTFWEEQCDLGHSAAIKATLTTGLIPYCALWGLVSVIPPLREKVISLKEFSCPLFFNFFSLTGILAFFPTLNFF